MTTSPRFIPNPERSGAFGAALIILAVLLLTFVSFARTVPAMLFPAACTLVIAAWFRRDLHPLHLAAFTAALIAVRSFAPSLHPWPYTLLIPLLVSFSASILVPRLRGSHHWLRRGTMGKDEIVSILIIAAVSGTALFLWVLLSKPDLAAHLKNIPDMPVWLFPLAGLAFAAANAAMEEIIYRGMIMQALDSAAGTGLPSLLGQAWLFGAMHFLQGFPNGWWGVAMTFAYGVMLGWLRRLSQGLLAPWLAHVFADLVIFVLVAERAVK